MRFFHFACVLIVCFASLGCNADVIKQATAYSRTVKMYTAGAASGLTGATLTVNISQAGGAFSLIAPTVTEIGNGWYKIALTSGHTNTLGALNMYITATGADPTDTADQIVAYDPTDATALGLSRLDAAISTRSTVAGIWGDNTTYGVGTKGAQLAAAGSSGDPWATALPGSYASGTAGNLLGNMIINLQAMTVDGSLTFKQLNAIILATSLESVRTWNATTHTAVLTYYRRAAGATSSDNTKPIMVKTTVYAADNVQVVSQSITLSNLP